MCVCVDCLVGVGLVVKGGLMGDSNAQIWLGGGRGRGGGYVDAIQINSKYRM